MKPINKYRTTKHFNLTGADIDRILSVVQYVKERWPKGYLIALVPSVEGEGELGLYTIRVSHSGSLVDYRVDAGGYNVKVLEERVIVQFSDVVG